MAERTREGECLSPTATAGGALLPLEPDGNRNMPGSPREARLDDPIGLEFRDKVVAAGLALGTALVVAMLGLGAAFVFVLVLMAPVLTRPAIRRLLCPPRRETFAAYYVAWLYGPLGWGLYRGVRWAQALGAALAVAVTLWVL